MEQLQELAREEIELRSIEGDEAFDIIHQAIEKYDHNAELRAISTKAALKRAGKAAVPVEGNVLPIIS
jgi:hypothetical protein